MNKLVVFSLLLLLVVEGLSDESSKETKIVRRKILKKKLDLESSKSKDSNSTVSISTSVSSSVKPGATASFTEQRRALFNRLNKPLLKNRAVDDTISKLRSRLGQALTTKKVLKKVKKASQNDSMIMIPVPESQRKPYQPVIMQVSKGNSSSSTPAPDTEAKVVTYKLNKMFVPLGIYGKVVENATQAQVDIKHKGSEERKEKAFPEDVDLTYNPKIDVSKIDLTTEKIDVGKIDLTNRGSGGGGGSGANDNRRWGQNNGGGGGGHRGPTMSPPSPLPQHNQQPSILDKFRQTASNIPGLFHHTLTSLQKITTNYNSQSPFQDSVSSGSSNSPSFHKDNYKNSDIVASVPGGNIDKSNLKSQYETLEYFRNRPYLRSNKGVFDKKRAQGGFHPATAPSRIAEEYYASASTNPAKPTQSLPTTEESSYGWFTKEFGKEPQKSNSWRSFFGFGPEIERGMNSPTTYNSQSHLSGARRRSIYSKWSQLTTKYTPEQLQTARDQLYSMAERNDFRQSNSLVRELMNMFELVFNVGGGRSGDIVRNFGMVGHVSGGGERNQRSGGGDNPTSSSEWRPVSEKSGRPLISFSAGVSFPSGSKASSSSSSHFSSSKRPFIPQKFNSLTNSISEAASSMDTEPMSSASEVDDKYELVPSDVFFSEKNRQNQGEIAAVVKPAGVSDEDLRKSIPSQIVGGVPVVEYKSKPNLHQLQKYLSTSPLLQQNSERAQKYKQKEDSFQLPQKYYDELGSMKKRVQQVESARVEPIERMDSDLAELIREELAKEEIDFADFTVERDSHSNSRVQVQPKSHSHSQPQKSKVKVNPVQTHMQMQIPVQTKRIDTPTQQRQYYQLQYEQQPIVNQQQRHYQVSSPPQYRPSTLSHSHSHTQSKRPVTKFFAPIPISPTIMSQTMRGRYNSPVPRYVVELAKKLQKDRDVQGIVRVSTRRGFGPPIEYLYPVRG